MYWLEIRQLLANITPSNLDMSATAITDAVTTLAEAERRFNLNRTEDENFLSEWRIGLPTQKE